MPQRPPHTVTSQETAIHEAMVAGDTQAIEDMEEAAHSADPKPPSQPPPKGWKPPVAQYQEDHHNAWNTYQDDSEPPESDREQWTRDAVEAENEEATQEDE